MMLITTEQWLPLWLINQFWVFGWEGSEKLRSSWKLLQFWFFWSSHSRYHGCGRSALLATAEVAWLPEMVCFLSSLFFLLTDTFAAFHHRGSFALVQQVVQLPSISCCCLCIALFAAKVSSPNLCARAHVEVSFYWNECLAVTTLESQSSLPDVLLFLIPGSFTVSFTVLPSELTAEDTCLQTQQFFLFPEVCLKCVPLSNGGAVKGQEKEEEEDLSISMWCTQIVIYRFRSSPITSNRVIKIVFSFVQ